MRLLTARPRLLRRLPAVAVLAVAATATATPDAGRSSPAPLVVSYRAHSSVTASSARASAPVKTSWNIETTTADGSRPQSLSLIRAAWYGVTSRGRYFPRCTIDAIDAAQSDKGCPARSLIATGSVVAVVGPARDFGQPGVRCDKALRFYNSGQDRVTVFVTGPAATCAGVGYLSPFPATWTRRGGLGGGQRINVPVPFNATHPLPGILGSLVKVEVSFDARPVRVRGRSRGYLESIGCTTHRSFRLAIVGDPDQHVYSGSGTAGRC